MSEAARRRELARADRILPGIWRLRLPLPWPGVPHVNAFAVAAGNGVVLVGPHAHLNGARVDDDAFVATGASIFPGARVGARAEVRIGAVVHVNSALAPGETVPIGWVAVGDPACAFPPGRHDEIWAIQRELDFPGTVFGLPRPPEGETLMPEAMRRYCDWLGRHRGDRLVG